MTNKKFGPIEVITGQNGSRVPYSTSLLIKGKEGDALIDCGGGQQVFRYIRENYNIKEIYLTHYHLDHVWGTSFFDGAGVAINPYDLKKLSDLHELAKANGIQALYGKEGVERWARRQQNKPETDEPRPRWKHIIGTADRTYAYEQPIQVGETTMTVIHTPGHTEGYCCPYFPEFGVLYAGDFDLTSFGPWYMDADSDIDRFFSSAERTLEVDAKYYVTGHHKGTFKRKEYEQQLERYMNKILEREENTKKAVQKGVPPKDIVYREIFYLLKNHKQSKHFLASEILGIAKHLQRLIMQGYDFEDYFQDFIACHGIHEEWLNYQGIPETV